MNTALPRIEAVYKKNIPSVPFEYKFADEEYAQKFAAEERTGKLAGFFAALAIFISCLGLYGLISFMTLQRTKEVGIRKTLGASVANIVYLFSKEFTVLILVAFVISSALGYYFMHKWLQDFTYRIPISPDIFILAIIASITIAWATVGYKAVKAALANPVKSLRSE